ncbi:multinuclear nonheme iron-dependent oxidase [Sorangium sp. So ce1182]|uniref:multinuclear nonheme iron-dependent oxidase n=1 Tax=Sorangium sp. So ce1182 TaxID=3133334 RepID=UPI003F5E4277
MLVDSHSHAVEDGSWDVLRAVVQRAGVKGVVIERDANFPPSARCCARSTKHGPSSTPPPAGPRPGDRRRHGAVDEVKPRRAGRGVLWPVSGHRHNPRLMSGFPAVPLARTCGDTS